LMDSCKRAKASLRFDPEGARSASPGPLSPGRSCPALGTSGYSVRCSCSQKSRYGTSWGSSSARGIAAARPPTAVTRSTGELATFRMLRWICSRASAGKALQCRAIASWITC
jgi:hypothetical protein